MLALTAVRSSSPVRGLPEAIRPAFSRPLGRIVRGGGGRLRTHRPISPTRLPPTRIGGASMPLPPEQQQAQHGEILTAISDGLVALLKEFHGRGPTRAK